jgi:hypothetical protein
MKDFGIGQVLAFVDICLTNLVGRLIVEILGGEGGSIDHTIARVSFRDDMLLNDLHTIHLSVVNCR